MARGPRFTSVPNIPQGGVSDWQFQVLNSLKENVELLTGARGSDNSVKALTVGQLSVTNPPNQNMTRVSASGAGVTLGNVTVPTLDDYSKLISDVQQLANDLAAVRNTLNTLINQIRG